MSEMDASSSPPAEQTLRGFLITFGLLALVMYFKGIVRVSLIHMFLSILPSLLLIAVLFQHRMTFVRPIRMVIKEQPRFKLAKSLRSRHENQCSN